MSRFRKADKVQHFVQHGVVRLYEPSLQDRLQQRVALIGALTLVGLSNFAKHAFVEVRIKQRRKRPLVVLQRRQQLLSHSFAGYSRDARGSSRRSGGHPGAAEDGLETE